MRFGANLHRWDLVLGRHRCRLGRRASSPRKLPDVTVSRVIKIREMLTQMHDYKQAVPRSYR